jgi:hypothetical protein
MLHRLNSAGWQWAKGAGIEIEMRGGRWQFLADTLDMGEIWHGEDSFPFVEG